MMGSPVLNSFFTSSEVEHLQQDIHALGTTVAWVRDFCAPQDIHALGTTVAWVRDFCAQPHPQLGRTGPVCPFVPFALHIDTLWFTVARFERANDTQMQIERVVECCRNTFFDLQPHEGPHVIYKAIVIIFPDMAHADAPELIDTTQKKLKPSFVKRGLMIGEFHQLIQTSGLYNLDFHPLRSPIPMLVIRSLVETDFPFLLREIDAPLARAQCLEAYLELLGHKFSETKLKAVQEALARVKLESDAAEARPTEGHRS